MNETDSFIIQILGHPLTLAVLTAIFGAIHLIIAHAVYRFTRTIDRLSAAISRLEISEGGVRVTLVEHGKWMARVERRIERIEEKLLG